MALNRCKLKKLPREKPADKLTGNAKLRLTSCVVCMVCLFMVPRIEATSEITLVVSPDAKMLIEEVERPSNTEHFPLTRWFRVDLVVRLSPGVEARLFLEPAMTGTFSKGDSSGGPLSLVMKLPGGHFSKSVKSYSESLHIIRRSGRQSLLIGIEVKPPLNANIDITDSMEFVLKSSDGAFLVKRTIPKTIGDGISNVH